MLVYGKWERISLTVTVYGNGADSASTGSFTVISSQPGGALAAPEKTGFTFGGWYYDIDCTEAYDPAAPVLNDLSVYAKWIVRDDSADLNGDDTSSILDVTALLRYLSTGDPQVVVLERVDVNGDGICSILDVTTLLNILAG